MEVGYGAALKHYRQRAGLKQRDIVDKMRDAGYNVTQAQVSQWQNATKPPRLTSSGAKERIEALANILGVDADVLISGVIQDDADPQPALTFDPSSVVQDATPLTRSMLGDTVHTKGMGHDVGEGVIALQSQYQAATDDTLFTEVQELLTRVWGKLPVYTQLMIRDLLQREELLHNLSTTLPSHTEPREMPVHRHSAMQGVAVSQSGQESIPVSKKRGRPKGSTNKTGKKSLKPTP